MKGTAPAHGIEVSAGKGHEGHAGPDAKPVMSDEMAQEMGQ